LKKIIIASIWPSAVESAGRSSQGSVARRRALWARLALCVAVATLCAGCGSRLSEQAIADAAHRPIVHGSALAEGAASSGQVGDAAAGTAAAGSQGGAGTGATGSAGSGGASNATGASAHAATPGAAGTAPGGSARSASGGSTINLGNVGTYSGVIGAVFSGAQQTLGVWQAYVNAHGGLNGHPIHLYIEDDGGDPSTSVTDVQQEVTQDHVIAFVGNLMPLTVQASTSYLQQQNIPVIGGDASSPSWWQSPILFPQGSSDLGSDQAVFTIKAASAKGYTKMGVLYCVEDPTCSAGIQSLIQQGGGSAAGVTTVYSSSFSITQPDFTAQCLDAKQAGATLIYFAGDGDSLIRMANDCAAQGYKPLYVGDSLAITSNLASDPNLNGLLAGQTDFPWMDSYTPAQATYQQAVKQYDPGLAGSATTAGEWTAGMLAVAASSDLTATPTSAEFFQGLWSIKNNDLGGLAPPLTFNANSTATPSNCFFLMTLQNGQFVDVQNGGTQCVS
jgi:branched-chain amino acid transport system substrate-binding protein